MRFRQTKYRRDVRYFVDMVGMATHSVEDVSLDDKYALIQVYGDYSVFITPPIGMPLPNLSEIVFYTHCLSYDHDMPAFMQPSRGKGRRALIEPIQKRAARYTNDQYFENVTLAHEALAMIRWGPVAYVEFRWSRFPKSVDLPYTKTYSSAARELSLYSTAVRQLDPLSEFLSYYRVIESVSGSNGKNWISSNVSRLKDYDFGFVHFGAEDDDATKRRRTNLFSVYRRRALSRVRQLNSRLKGRSVADYFYHDIRCGIAHGKSGVKAYDFGENIEEVSKDNYVLKLLSRIAIEDRAGTFEAQLHDKSLWQRTAGL